MPNVLQQMKTWPAHMNTYNKLRTPNIDTARLDDTASPVLTVRSFQNYIEKFKVVFETCASSGVPSHSTETTGTICTLVRYWRAVFTLGQQLVVFLGTHCFGIGT